jgi:hypothetical protein
MVTCCITCEHPQGYSVESGEYIGTTGVGTARVIEGCPDKDIPVSIIVEIVSGN